MAGVQGAKEQLEGKLGAAAQALKEGEEKPLALESAEQAEAHRKARGEEEPISPRRSGLGRHYDIGGVADYGPVDTERNQQVDSRDIPARVP